MIEVTQIHSFLYRDDRRETKDISWGEKDAVLIGLVGLTTWRTVERSHVFPHWRHPLLPLLPSQRGAQLVTSVPGLDMNMNKLGKPSKGKDRNEWKTEITCKLTRLNAYKTR